MLTSVMKIILRGEPSQSRYIVYNDYAYNVEAYTVDCSLEISNLNAPSLAASSQCAPGRVMSIAFQCSWEFLHDHRYSGFVVDINKHLKFG